MIKDPAVGALLLIVCVLVIVGYVAALFLYPVCIQPWLNLGSTADVQFWLIAIPVLIAFVDILAIGAWIGLTMATTPPPKPIEDINAQTDDAKTTPQQ